MVVARGIERHPLTAYNLAVANWHTYFVVGAEAANDNAPTGWLHNCDIWTGGVENAYRHWAKHKVEFPELNNATEYVAAPQRLLQGPPAPGVLSGTRQGGEVVRWDTHANTFGVLGANGAPTTMFRHREGIGYFANDVANRR